MNVERRNKLMIRWSILTAALIALFWLVWYLFAGEVPSVDRIKWVDNIDSADVYTDLPFSVSRWFDVLLGPVYSVAIIGLVSFIKNQKDSKYGEIVIGLVAGVTTGVVGGFTYGFAQGLTRGLVASLVSGLLTGLITGFVFGLTYSRIFVFIFGLTFGLVVSIGFAFVYGLVPGVIIALIYGLMSALGARILMYASRFEISISISEKK